MKYLSTKDLTRSLKFLALGLLVCGYLPMTRVTNSVRVFWAVPPRESLTLTVKLKLPALVGVPVILPVAVFRLKPGGSLPETKDHG